MRIEDKYPEGSSNEFINSLHGLDDDVTIKQIRDWCSKRNVEREQEIKDAQEALIKEIDGKCFVIKYSDKHKILIKIDRIKIVGYRGDADANMYGTKIVNYEGNLEIRPLTLEENEDDIHKSEVYSNYFSIITKEGYIKEITEDLFNETLSKIKDAQNMMGMF